MFCYVKFFKVPLMKPSLNTTEKVFPTRCYKGLRTRGIPRYFEGNDPVVNPSVLAKKACVGAGVLNKKMFDLSLLIIIPEACMKSWKMIIKALASRRKT